MMDFPAVKTVTGDTRSVFGPRGQKTWLRSPGDLPPKDFDVDDGGLGFARLANGANMLIHITWAEHSEPQDDDFRVELQGSEGTAIMHVRNYRMDDSLRYYTEIEGEPVTVIPSARTWPAYHHEAMIQDLVSAIVRDQPSPTTAEQGLAAIQVLEALYHSAETGREVVLS
jgi:predicted dehydrogenase